MRFSSEPEKKSVTLSSARTATNSHRTGSYPYFRFRSIKLVPVLLALTVTALGCSALPRRYVQHTVYNPFPEISRVAVVPFFNHSKEPTVNGAEFARAYYLELQSVPGFEVVPVEVVGRALRDSGLQLKDAVEVRRLAEILDVDAVVIGVITDYQPYYPPRCGLHVEWYARDPSVRPVPPGFGIPWGTRRARKLPEWLKLESAIAAERQRLVHQDEISPSGLDPLRVDGFPDSAGSPAEQVPIMTVPALPPPQVASSDYSLEGMTAQPKGGDQFPGRGVEGGQIERIEPFMVHTRVFSGNDPDFAKDLAVYYQFREDARFGGWQGYLERSEDFIRFCCRLHIHQMLMARGGVAKKQVRWDWPLFR